MNNSTVNGQHLEDELLAKVSGGVAEAGTTTQKKCPLCHGNVVFSRNTRLDGGNLTLYKCNNCNREFSLLQIKGEEDLSVNYTGLGNDKFGK